MAPPISNFDHLFGDVLGDLWLDDTEAPAKSPSSAQSSTLGQKLDAVGELLAPAGTTVMTEVNLSQRNTGIHGAAMEVLPLGPKDTDGYLGMVSHVLNSVRLRGLYPDTQALSKHLLTVREGLRHKTFGIDAKALKATGLPDYGAWRSGLRMAKLREAILTRSGQMSLRHALAALERPGDKPAWVRSHDRKAIRAMMAVEQHGVADLESVEVRVVDVGDTSDTLRLQLIRDAYAYPGVIQRTCIELAHNRSDWRDELHNWASGVLTRENGHWLVHGDLRKLLQSASARPLSQLLMDVSRIVGEESVHKVSRGAITSVWFDGVDAPLWLAIIDEQDAVDLVNAIKGTNDSVTHFQLDEAVADAQGDAVTISGIRFRQTQEHTLAATAGISSILDDSVQSIKNITALRVSTPNTGEQHARR